MNETPEQDTRGLMSDLDLLQNRLERVYKTLDQMIKQLAPILGPAPSRPELASNVVGDQPDSFAGSPARERLASLIGMAENMQIRLAELMERAEL